MNLGCRLLALALATTGVLAVGTAAEAAAPTAVTGGNVSIALNTHTRQAVTGHGFKFAAIAKATLHKQTLKFPITGGAANPPNYSTKLAGGFKYTKNGHTDTITHIVFNTATKKASADVTHHGNIDVFLLGNPEGGAGGPGKVSFGPYTVKLTGVFAKALDHDFGTSVFVGNPKFGNGATTVTFKS